MADFSEFQLKEYENISHAHFKTNEMMVAFYRYYLLIMALPISFSGAGFISSTEIEKYELLLFWQIPISVFLFVVALLGFFMMCYLTGLRIEALLYARTVNGVRSYFYQKVDLDTVRVLPVDTNIPKFTKFGDHIFIVLSFAIFNTLYLISSYFIYFIQIKGTSSNHIIEYPEYIHFFAVLIIIISFFLHVKFHNHLCKEREKKWVPIEVKAPPANSNIPKE